ncbi:MAG: DUF1080 domain-containing protein [Verrucomicrobiota bacterium]
MKTPALIGVTGVAAALCFAAIAQDTTTKEDPPTVTGQEFVPIFDGETLDGWDGEAEFWSVEDGAITGTTTDDDPIPYNKFIIWENGEVDDFELKLKYRIIGGNSGIQYRSFVIDKDPKKGTPLEYVLGGYQADIDSSPKFSGIVYGEKFRGIHAKRGEKTVMNEDGKPELVEQFADAEELQSHINEEDWNEYHIIAKGNHVIHKINGVVMSESTDNDTDERRDSGLLGFQIHRGPPMKVQFKDIELKRLPLEDKKKVVFVAGAPSHAPRAHEHNAGSDLLAALINEHYGDEVLATVYHSGWPADRSAFQNADAVVIFSDGGQRHPGFFHRRQLDYLADQGIGIGCIHYAVEMLPDESNQDLISWIGGAFETFYSVNPHWTAQFTDIPDHPVANGVAPFDILDEWYFNMRFADNMDGVTPILSAIPPDETMSRPDGHHSGNPEVRKMVADKLPQHVVWVYDRDNGGRGFGFTGGHFHDNWADDNFRKTALNAIAWIAKADVPESGINTPTPSADQMNANLDPKPAKKPKKPKKKAA